MYFIATNQSSQSARDCRMKSWQTLASADAAARTYSRWRLRVVLRYKRRVVHAATYFGGVGGLGLHDSINELAGHNVVDVSTTAVHQFGRVPVEHIKNNECVRCRSCPRQARVSVNLHVPCCSVARLRSLLQVCFGNSLNFLGQQVTESVE